MTDLAEVIDTIIDDHEKEPVDILGIGDVGEHRYLRYHRDGFERTLRDVDGWCAANPRQGGSAHRILEIGSFLGPVSVGLARMGRQVEAVDLPEYAESPRLQAYYKRNGVRLRPVNLRQHHLPFADGSLDVIIICEVIEHLNFNPLLVLHELNRVLAVGGLLYIGMPNHASIRNRVRVVTGRSLHNPIDDYFAQLDPTKNMLVGLHWREYTLAETKDLVTRIGFRVDRSYYFYEKARTVKNPLKKLVKTALFAYPALRPQHVVLAVKERTVEHEFWLTEANT
jgi:SAM-dependent methyltransferase